MGRTRFKYNEQFDEQVRRDRKYKAAMEHRADRIATGAQKNGGRFTKGYKPVQTSRGARAGTSAPFAHWDEWGNRFRSPRSPLRRSLSSLGLLRRTKIKGK